MAGRKPTKLDALVDEAADLVRQLEQLDGSRKLSYKAFLKESLRIGDCTEKRIAVVRKVVYERHGTEHIQAFLRRFSKAISEPNYPRPFPDPSRPTRIFGSEDLMGQMGQFTILAGELQALAVLIAFERFGDQAFGKIEKWEPHQQQTTELRAKLNAIYGQMREVVCGLDLIFDTSRESLMEDEIARGLCRASFKRAPAIGPHQGDWPQALVRSVAAETPKKRTRDRISKAA